MKYDQRHWGVEFVWADTGNYSGRTMVIKENNQTAYQYHKKQDITIFVLQGALRLTIEGRDKILNEGESYHISPKLMYRLAALQYPVTILEAGTKIEDDIVIVEK